MRGEVVQRVFGPRFGRELGDERVGQPHVLGMLAQLARGAEMEEPGFGAAAGADPIQLASASRALP